MSTLIPGETLDWPSLDETVFDTAMGFKQTTGFHDPRGDERRLTRETAALELIAESAPGLQKAIKLLWGTQQLHDTLFAWVMDGYQGARLPHPVCEALIALSDLHARKFRL